MMLLFGPSEHLNTRSSSQTPAADLDILLVKRSEELRHHAGQIAFPGGGIDPGDVGPAAAALREAQEETGLRPQDVAVLGELSPLYIPNSDNLVTPVLAWWEQSSRLVPDGIETSAVFRVPVAELLDPQNRLTAVYRRGELSHRGPLFQLGSQFGENAIWGFTAMVLDSIFEQLGWATPWDVNRRQILTLN